MTEINLWEALPSLNNRSDLGRITLKYPDATPVQPHVSGRVTMCVCNRFFLTQDSYQAHKNTCAGRVPVAISRDSNRIANFNHSDSAVRTVHNGFGLERPVMNGLTIGINRSPFPPSQNRNNNCIPFADNSRWVVTGRKVSILKRGQSPSSDTSSLSEDRSGSSASPTKIMKQDINSTPTTPSAASIMSLVNLENSSNGNLILRCKECNYCAGETSVITEHIKQNHLEIIMPQPVKNEVKIEIKDSNNKPPGSPKVYVCDLCNVYKTTFSGNIMLHKKSAHASQGYSCQFCSCVYETKGGLTLHVGRYHRHFNVKDRKKVLPTTNLMLKEELTPPQQINQCPQCIYVAPNSVELKQHMENFHKSVKQLSSFPAKFKCDLCHFQAKSTVQIKRHKEKSHVRDGRFKCQKCPCTFSSIQSLSLHRRYHKTPQVMAPQNGIKIIRTFQGEQKNVVIKHKGFKKIAENKCNICQKIFFHRYQLQIHVRTFHSKQNTSKNGRCSKGTASNSNTCDVCRKHFSNSYSLLVHQTNCHVEGGGFPCTISGCECVMGSASSFQNHIKKCQLSRRSEDNSKFATSDQPKNEGESHNHEMYELNNETSSVICDLCQFKASSNAELNQHLKSSHVICGVECECNCSFSTATELTYHKNNECRKNLETIQIVNVVSMADDSSAQGTSKPAETDNVDVLGTCSCGQSFKNRSELVSHKNECMHNKTDGEDDNNQDTCRTSNTHQEPGVVCSKCNKTFKNVSGLTHHKNSVHGELFYYSHCQICQYPTPNYPRYKSHKKNCHVENGVPCPECPTTFKSIHNLARHFLPRHKRNLDMKALEIRCTTCDFVTYRPIEMDKHEKKGHNPRVTTPKLDEEKKVHQCTLCNYKTSSASSVESHMKTNHIENGFQCFSCNNSFATKMGRRTHFSIVHKDEFIPEENEENLHKCQICDFTAKNLSHVHQHLATNHVENGFGCKYCNHSFATNEGLNTHVRMLHGKLKEEDYRRCKLCGYVTSNEKYYKRHMKTNHIENGYKCPDCPCSLKTANSLLHHAWMLHKTRINKDDFKVKCEHCDYSTLHKENLRSHIKSVHSSCTPIKSKEAKIPCAKCGAEMIESSMEDHLKRAHVEGGHTCDDCTCSFSNINGLARHVYMKHGKKLEIVKEWDVNVYPESCTQCDLRFKTKLGLYYHCLKKHGFTIELPKTVKLPGEKKRACEFCGYTFSGTVVSHMRRYHVENGFKCSHCCCAFETYTARSRHLIKSHKVFTPKRCNICQNKFLGTIKKHIEKCHVAGGLPCGMCCCSFESAQGRVQHEIKVHKKFRPKVTTCETCGFTITSTLQDHMQRCHVPNGVKCEYCQCSFETEQGKQQHLKTRHKVIALFPKLCNLCGLTLYKVTMKYHLEFAHVPNGLECSHCSCSFRSENVRIRHLKHYHNVLIEATPKICKLCGMSPTYPLERHIKKHHVKDGHPCAYCPCSFESKLGRRVHMRRTHGQTKDPFRNSDATPLRNKSKGSGVTCHLCGLQITESMRDHINRNHLQTNKFRCSHCCCCFKTSFGLKHHITVQHKKEKPIVSSARSVISKKISIKTMKDRKDVKIKSLPKTACGEQSSNQIINVDKKVESIVQNPEPSVLAPIEPENTTFPCSVCSRTFPSKIIRNMHVTFSHRSGRVKKIPERESSSKAAKVVSTLNKPRPPSPEIEIIEIKTPPSTSTSFQSTSNTETASSSKSHIEQEFESVLPIAKEKLTCPSCGYRAASISHLNMHLQKSHVKNSRFPCKECTCSYKTEQELERHMKTLHSKRA